MLLLGSNVSENKAAFFALQAIYGVGQKSAAAVCNLVGINPQTRLRELNSTQLELLTKSCRRLIASNKKREKVEAIKSLIKISCYRGTRHMNALPCRGQRTRTNAYTSKNLLSKLRNQLK
uniref:Ribosomal protein S13 n=1 Tax=Tupiella akineta TaxID=160070 RepID=Q6UVP6_TUPAK|nr:ribosomal protein S13 [Tupiella akineta]AAQ18778.1 ribosomal protein S13 [Tupiella akineta]